MSYESCYNSARRRYYNACSEINSCENRINDLKAQKQKKINQINQLKTDIKNHQIAFDDMSQIIKKDEVLNKRVLEIQNKTTEAAENYIGMVQCSDVASKDLNVVYKDESTKTKSTLDSIVENLKAKNNWLSAKISELEGELRNAESDLRDIENRITSTESDLQYWRRTKSNASIDMEYYRRKMNERF